MVKVPDVTGKTYEEAQKELNKYDLGIHKSTAPSDTVEKGKIISQDPADGKKVKKHTTVNVVISSGEEAKTTTIPNVVGMSEADAEKALQDKNLVVKKGDPVYSDDVEQGEGEVYTTVVCSSNHKDWGFYVRKTLLSAVVIHLSWLLNFY